MVTELDTKDQPSRVLITFKEPGSVLFDLQFDGMVSPLQMLTMAEYFRVKYGNQILAAELKEQIEQAQKQELGKIQKPGDGKIEIPGDISKRL